MKNKDNLEPKKLGILAFLGNFTQFYFETDADPTTPGFLSRVAYRMRAGDEIKVTRTNKEFPYIENYTVVESDQKTVTIRRQGKENPVPEPEQPKEKGSDDATRKPEDGPEGVGQAKAAPGQSGSKEPAAESGSADPGTTTASNAKGGTGKDEDEKEGTGNQAQGKGKTQAQGKK